MIRNQIEEGRRKEAYIRAELYRFIKNAISRGLAYRETKCEFIDIIPEFPIGKERADLVVLAVKYGGRPQPYLVLETKVRAYFRPGPSAVRATRTARSYAEKLDMLPSYFFATYDGWTLFVFRDISPYLIGVYGPVTNESHIENLLLGLEEYSYKGKSDLLNNLPKPADPDFIARRVLPSIARQFVQSRDQILSLVGSWKNALSLGQQL